MGHEKDWRETWYMKNTIGNSLTVTLFGESHGKAIGAVIDGIPAGVKIDYELMADMMEKRKAVGTISTVRREDDIPQFLSGIKDGYSEGTSIAFIIPNENVHKDDYVSLQNIARPSHADYTAHIKYRGYEDASGGGHFSGRLTAPLTAAGAICMSMLNEKGIQIGTHIASLHGLSDRPFDEQHLEDDISMLNERKFAVLDEKIGGAMVALINEARKSQDSIGGVLDTAVIGLEAGVGEPEFDSIESELSRAVFSIPAVKGIEFGAGFGFADMYGSEANDPFCMKNGKVCTETNYNGGINGGISNGMPIRFRTVIKPTPSIAKKQKSVDYETGEEKDIEIVGRHDPAIIHRARIVVDAMTAITLCDLLMQVHGSLWFAGEKK
jgi:chorismate synthase